MAGLSRALPPNGPPTVSLCPRRRRENGASLWTIANLMRLPCPTHTPSPSLKTCWKIKIFSISDLSEGFHHIPLHPESRAKTAMNLVGKRYQWRVTPMGIKNGPAIFQRVMDRVLQGLNCADVYCYQMMEGPMFQHSNLLLLIVVPLFQRQGEPLVTLIRIDLRGGFLDDRRI